MIVKELIEELSKYEQDEDVYFYDLKKGIKCEIEIVYSEILCAKAFKGAKGKYDKNASSVILSYIPFSLL